MLQVLTIGGVTSDVFISYQGAACKEVHEQHKDFLMIEEGIKIEASAINYHVGGGALNTATSFKKLGCKVTCCFRCGADTQALQIKEFLRKKDITMVNTVSYEQATATSFILPTPSGNRIIFAHRGAHSELSFEDIAWELQSYHDIVYVTSLSGKAASLLPTIASAARAQTRILACNPGSNQLQQAKEYLIPAFSTLDILLVNLKEAQQLYTQLPSPDKKLFSLKDFFSTLRSYGVKIIAVTDGVRGAYVAHENSYFFHPSLPVKTVSTVGAGDAFGSCFVASIAQGDTIEVALIKAIINSAHVLQYMNAQEGLLTKAALEEKCNNFEQKLEIYQLDK